ncbi:unnamed protein product [Vitrella brassicaformis CCMP3155]|uniref:Uncharacterized protein n=1 Tax=Vitrella brassicaformis (strain CCMP3155) TaxID=1169540 RepID=A0A0G4GKH1_VITBC|nr:unnamed protein product [Vitrella brassicaformis CCMP3155]|eukprot:CEM30519.1 unnamed protein product [Vitrella brassicaformis CCMP3155]
MAEIIAVGMGLWQCYASVKLLCSTANIVKDVSSGNRPKATDVVRVAMGVFGISIEIEPLEALVDAVAEPVAERVADAAAAIEEHVPGLLPQMVRTGVRAHGLAEQEAWLGLEAGHQTQLPALGSVDTDLVLTKVADVAGGATRFVLQNQDEIPMVRNAFEKLIAKGFEIADWDKTVVLMAAGWADRAAAARSVTTTRKATPELPGLQAAWLLASDRAKILFDAFGVPPFYGGTTPGRLRRHHLVGGISKLTDEQFDAWADGKESIDFARCVAVMLEMVIMCFDMCAVCDRHLLDEKAVAAPCKPTGKNKHYRQTSMGWTCPQCGGTLVLTKAAAGTMCFGCRSVVTSGVPVYHCRTCPDTLLVGLCTRCEAARGFVRTCPKGHHLIQKDMKLDRKCQGCPNYMSNCHRCSVCEYNLCQTCIRPNRSLNSS